MTKYKVTDKDGKEINAGDTVTDFRGETATFLSVSRPPLPGKSAKVIVDCGAYKAEYYCSVYNLTVTPES